MTGPSLTSKNKRAAFMRDNPKVREWTLLYDVDCRQVLCRCKCGREALVAWGTIRDPHGSTRCQECAKIDIGGRKNIIPPKPEDRRLLKLAYEQKDRCTNPNNAGWHKYGARGITFEFESPKAAAQYMLTLGPRPTPQHSIDRIDNDKGYAVGNLRWASRVEQQANSRTCLGRPPAVPKLTPDEKREQFIERNPRIGRWTLVRDLGCRHCLCRCECGIERPVAWASLRSGVSAGCQSCSGKYGRKL
jgi:hypothetical protein